MKTIDLSKINLNISENDKKRPMIFYAAGRFAKANIEILRENGIVPVCFADKDETKHGTVFCGYKICSLETALKRYPDALVVLTYGKRNLTPLVREMAQIVDSELLRFPYDTYYGLGCDFLGTNITLFYNGTVGCCYGNRFVVPNVSFADPLDVLLPAHPNYSEKIIQKIIAGEEQSCTGCKELKEGFWEIKPRVNCFVFTSTLKGAKCNYDCPECSHGLKFKEKPQIDDQNSLVASEILQYFYDNYKNLNIRVDKMGVYCSLAIAEPVLLPDLNRILEITDKSNNLLIPSLTTNGSVYSERWVKSMVKNPKSFLICDISAGTVESYKKLKGVTCLDRVADNLEKYVKAALNPVQVRVKFTFFEGINDNFDDVNGFLEIVKRLRCKAEISNNMYAKLKITDKIGELYKYMVDELNRNNIVWENNVCQRIAFER